jgi:hypothetical protein
MLEFRVKLLGQNGEPSRNGHGRVEVARRVQRWRLRLELPSFTALPLWFSPEPVLVHLNRAVCQAPAGFELSLTEVPPLAWRLRETLLGRLAVSGLAALSMLYAATGQARASEAPAPLRPLPGTETSSVPQFTPTDQRPLLAVKRSAFDIHSFEPLLDAQGRPILLAHGNTPGSEHANTPGSNHTNQPWVNHSNSLSGHTNSAWTNGSVHTNMVPAGGEGFVF